MKPEDLTGKRFGKLTAIELGDYLVTPNGRKYGTWRCRCDCGRERLVRTTYLRQGDVTYCGECEPPDWLGAKNRKCRYCEFSMMNNERHDWDCTKGKDASMVKNQCDEFWCAPEDKLYGIKNKQGTCLICGKPVYTRGLEIPIYCYEHKAQADLDQKIIDEAPKELLFSLIMGIFKQARTDYLTNLEGQRSDAEVFLKGQWAQDLSLDGYDVENLFKILDEERKDGRSDFGKDS